MKKELGTVQDKVRRRIQQAEVPAFQKRTKKLQNEFKMLRSQRQVMEEQVPYIINTVRAQKTPEDAFTRCWDPTTGVKMKVKDIENALKELLGRIDAIKAPKAHEEHLSKIYRHMLARYKHSTNATANAAEEIRFKIRKTKRAMEPRVTALREAEDSVAATSVEIQGLLETREMRRLEYERTLLAMRAEHEENLRMITLGIKMRRRQAGIAEEERNKDFVQAKIDIRKVEALTARGAKSFLTETKRTSIPIQKAMEKLEKHGELREGSDFQEHFLGQEVRSDAVSTERASLEAKIEARKVKIVELQMQQREIESQGLHLFIKKEEDVNLWDIQEKIDEAARKEAVAERRYRKEAKILAMVQHGIANVIQRFKDQHDLEIEINRAVDNVMLANPATTATTDHTNSPGTGSLSSGGGSGGGGGAKTGRGTAENSPSSSRQSSPRSSASRTRHKKAHRSHSVVVMSAAAQPALLESVGEGQHRQISRPHPHHQHHHHHHHHHRHHHNHEESHDVVAMLDSWLGSIIQKEKKMHNKVGLLLANKARRFCKQISDLEFYKAGRAFVKARGDTLMTISSLGQMAMRFDPVNGMASPQRMLQKIRTLKGRSSRRAAAAEEATKKQTPKKKKLRRRSMLAAARQVSVTNRMKKMQAATKMLGKKKEDMNLLQDLDMFKQFMVGVGHAQESGGWTESTLNYRVGTSEIQGDVIDEKSLIKAVDPEEEALMEEMRMEGKAFSQEALTHSRRSSRSNKKRRGSRGSVTSGKGDDDDEEKEMEKAPLSVAEKKVKLRGLGLSNLKREAARAAKNYSELDQ
jgi:hypothetical protein